MNQILTTAKKPKKGPAEIKNIVLFFSISILLFGMFLVGHSAYAMYQYNKEQEELNRKDILALDITRDGNMLTLHVKNENTIDKVVYNWNNTEDHILLGKGRTEFSEQIELPLGNNVLNIKISDVTGRTKNYQQKYVLNESDITGPEIELLIAGDKVKIVARDDEQLSYITYRWNDEQETTITPRPESPAQIETEIDIKKGLNTLTVIAVDNHNNTEEKTQDFEGVTKPILQLTKEGNYLVITASDEDDGLDRVEYTINGQKYLIPLKYNEKTVTYKQELQSGENPFTIDVYNKNGDVTNQYGTCPN